MKKLILGLFCFATVFAFASFNSRNAYADAVATVKEIQGEVFIQPAGSTPETWSAVTQDTPVNNGDSVKTANGSCLLSYADQGEFRLGANTRLTVQQQTDTQDIHLLLGSLKAKINKDKVIKPFQVVTPTAVGAIRGTNVDFDFNDKGELTADLHDGGPVQVYNDEAGMELNLEHGNKITVVYNKDKGELIVTNSCDSKTKINFTILGKEYSGDQCQSVTVNLGTAKGGNDPTDTNDPDPQDPPNEHQPPDSSQTT